MQYSTHLAVVLVLGTKEDATQGILRLDTWRYGISYGSLAGRQSKLIQGITL